MRITLLGLGLSALFALTGCGGGSGGGTTPTTVTLEGTSGLCGWMAPSRSTVFTSGDLLVGDLLTVDPPIQEEGARTCVSFDLAPIPSGARVVSATLRLDQRVVVADPYASLGAVVVDQVVYGAVLDVGEYDRSFPSNQGFATLSTDATLGPKEADVTAAVQDDLAAPRTRSQFRLRFQQETVGDGQAHGVQLSNANSADPPLLIVTYQP